MRRHRLSLLVLVLLAAWTPAAWPQGTGTGEVSGRKQAASLQALTVQPGDTLWGLAQKYLKDPTRWTEILKYNELPTQDPTVALPGMTLRVPIVLIKEYLRSARVLSLVGEVLYRKMETPDWRAASLALELYPSDSMRTMRSAQARVRFGTGETLDILENSLVILAPPKVDADAQILKGEIIAQRSKVMTASARITPKTKDTEYSARVMEDLRTLVQVYQGRATVEAQGKSVEVPAGFASEVRLDEAPSLPREFPKLPAFAPIKEGQSPAGAPRLALKDGRLKLELPGTALAPLREEGTGKATVREAAPYSGYRIQTARDAEFRDIVLDLRRKLVEPFDFPRELKAGRYWWRIALIDPFGFESRFTEARMMELRMSAPALEVVRPAPQERITGSASDVMILVEGKTDPDATVAVDGRGVELGEGGRFFTQVPVKAGPRTIRVVASNRWGSTDVAREFVYEREKRLEPAKQEKTVLPEKTFEERILKPYLIPVATVLIFVAIGVGVVLIFL